MNDLGRAFLELLNFNHPLGARIILRSACETLALLAYLNKKILDTVEGRCDFGAFNEVTKQLLLGGKLGDYFSPVNVMTQLKHAAKDQPELIAIYERLCEDAHPNASGMVYAYSDSHPETLETNFHPKLATSDAVREHTLASADLIFLYFEVQYNQVWPERFVALEGWLRENDAQLEAMRNGG